MFAAWHFRAKLGTMQRSVAAVAMSGVCMVLALHAQAAEKETSAAADSGPRPRVVTITLIGHDFVQAKTQSGEVVKYAITANTQIGTAEYPQSLSMFRVGNIMTLTAEKSEDGWEALQVIAGDRLNYFLDPKRKRPAANAAPVRAGNILSITSDQLVLRVAGDKDFKYTLTPKTMFGDGKNPMKPSHFPPGSVAKIMAAKGNDGVLLATQVLPFIQDVGSRRQAKARQDLPDKVSPTPECKGAIVVIEPGYVEIRAKNGQCFKYAITASTQLGVDRAPLSLMQFKAGNFVKVSGRVGENGMLEAKQVVLVDYRK